VALDKQAIPINFAKGLDKKSDPKQVALGNFLALENSVFETGTLLQKRNGFGDLPTISGTNLSTDLATYLGNLIAIGDTLQVLNSDSGQWLNRGAIQPVSMDTRALVRTSGSQTTVDTAVAPNGLACSVFLDSGAIYYQVSDSVSGQIIVNRTALPGTNAMGRVFVLGNFFVITFLRSGPFRIQYVAVPLNNPSNPGSAVNLSSQVSSLSAGYDGIVANNSLYLAWDASDLGGAIRITALSTTLNQSNVVAIAGETADLMSVTADNSGATPTIWVSYWDNVSGNLSALAVNQILLTVLSPTVLDTGLTLRNLTSVADNQILTVIYDNVNTYSYSAVETDFLSKVTCTEPGVVGTPSNIIRSVGLASKAITFNNNTYFLTAYDGGFQPTYFLVDSNGTIIAKLAYSNGAGYPINQILAQINQVGSTLSVGYLIRDLLATVNKSQGNANPNGIYTQTGINLASFTLPGSGSIDAEIAESLHLTGGYLTQYDGAKPVEHSFAVWPEDIGISFTSPGGFMAEQTYFYQVTYEWTDAKGLLHRSAPSVPVTITTSDGGANLNVVTLKIPTLRLTAKTGDNPVRIVIYRWSTAQQVYYQVTSISSPLLNDPTVDSVTYVDTQADADILGNVILYTTGGVLENIAAPACSTSTMFDSRLWVVDAEDKNLLWFSKLVQETVPVEFNDGLTIYVTPTTAAQGNTGPITALSVLDDKLVIFKENSIYQLTGRGPDSTGANNGYSEPVFTTGTIGCTNQRSIVYTPQGLMFQSDKGIWLLDRQLGTSYIGAPVEAYNGATVVSALNIPGTNQVRFTLDTGVTLMYDYFYGQWGTFTGIPAVSSTLYQGLHTYLNEFGTVRQETPGKYLDGTSPVLLRFTTSWLNLAGLQGFQRLYYMYILGAYKTPHKLNIQWAYDYNDSPSQTVQVVPDNYSNPYGDESLYGGGPETYGGPGDVEWWRVFVNQQKCTAVRMTLTETYDPSYGVPAGQGLTISGLNFVVGMKKGYPVLRPSRSVG
jgi:hypothetical protein